MTNLEEQIKNMLGEKSFGTNEQADYHESFRKSGMQKGQRALKIIKEKNIDLSKSVYFSIGGSTGEEIEHVLKNSKINHGLILEFDPSAVNEIIRLQDRLKEMNKKIIYIPGDAYQQSEYCRRLIEKLYNDGEIENVICSVQAVFHELPFRSPNFNLRHFLSTVLGGWNRCILLCREPCMPVDWPEKVEISITDISGKILCALAKDINKSLVFNEKEICEVGKYVQMSSPLAVETLFKIFYLKDYQHEIEEKVTVVDPNELILAIENQLGQGSVTKSYINSESFERYYREMGIKARNPKTGISLSLPNVFLEIIADSNNAKKTDPVAIQESKNFVKIKAIQNKKNLLDVKFPDNPKRFLNRRCRVIYKGSNEFISIMHTLLSSKFDPGEIHYQYNDRINELQLPHEKMIARAIFMENIGAISEMKNIISHMVLEGIDESIRLLYKAIAHDKLDELDQAIDCLYKILRKETNQNITRAAQFNLNVCYEKMDMIKKVDFESFIDDNIIFADGERLSDKAVAMQLIHCMRAKAVFVYESQLDKSLNYLFQKSMTGYIKTYLTFLRYKQDSLSKESIKNFVQKTFSMDRNSQVAILTTLLRYTDQTADKGIRNKIIMARDSARVHKQSHSDPSISKWRDDDIMAEEI